MMKTPPPSLAALFAAGLFSTLYSSAYAVIRELPLPPQLQSCYERANNFTCSNYVGGQFCWYCESPLRTMMGGSSYVITPSQAKYVESLYQAVESRAYRPGREKRQATPPRLRCIRKECRVLTDQERGRLFAAFNALKADRSVPPNMYDAISAFHTGANNFIAHGGPGFPGWHRTYLAMIEEALRSKDPDACLCYWDSSLDASLANPARSNAWTDTFFGDSQGAVTSGPFANWITRNNVPLTRSVGVDGQPMTRRAIESIMSRNTYEEILLADVNPDQSLEVHHGAPHIFVGGDMERLETAANDPVFFLHHTFIDYLWDRFRDKMRSNGRNPEVYPVGASISSLHQPRARMGFGNITHADGYQEVWKDSFDYQLSPTCSRTQQDCGSRYLSCDVARAICVPVIPPALTTPAPTTQTPTTQASTTQTPTTQTPTTQTPRTTAPTTQTPTTQTPRTTAPTTQTPTTQTPRTTAPTTQTPTTQTPTTQTPTTQAPTTQTPTTQTPTTQTPTTQTPTTQTPTTQTPTTQTPTTQAPTTQTATTQTPTTQTPTTQTPTTQTPTTQTPTTQTPTTQTPRTPAPTTQTPRTQAPTTQTPMMQTPTTQAPTTQKPTTPATPRTTGSSPATTPSPTPATTASPPPFTATTPTSHTSAPTPTVTPYTATTLSPNPDPYTSLGSTLSCSDNSRPQAYQNSFCVDGQCDVSQWVWVPVKIVSQRPPEFTVYKSYPVQNNQIHTTCDIYQSSAYSDTSRYIDPDKPKPKAYENCEVKDGVGKIFVSSQGLNYDGYYKESAIVDQRLATSVSVAYIAVKDPGKGKTEVVLRAHDQCGRICHTACLVPGSNPPRYTQCSGVVQVTSESPRMYGQTYAEASFMTYDYASNAYCPNVHLNDFVTFYCDYSDRLPWLYKPAQAVAASSTTEVIFSPQPPLRAQCKVHPTCTITQPCYLDHTDQGRTCNNNTMMFSCKENCMQYVICNYGQFWRRTCPTGMYFSESLRQCTRGSC